MVAMRKAHGDHLQRYAGRRLRQLLWAVFAFTIVTCYSAQVAHLYKGGQGARQCERCQGDLHVASEPVVLQSASTVPTPPQPDIVFSFRFTSRLPDPRGIRPRGRAPPSLRS
jgi:hypothetical protein